jgi:multidrug efflux pump subunit AcrB
MTAIAFILGSVPLILTHGAGAASRFSIGLTVVAGMTAATVLGILVIPALYVLFGWFGDRSGKATGEGAEEKADGKA